MNFYTQQHKHYCGIDLHAKAMYVCILDQSGTKLVYKNLPTTPESLRNYLVLFQNDAITTCECASERFSVLGYLLKLGSYHVHCDHHGPCGLMHRCGRCAVVRNKYSQFHVPSSQGVESFETLQKPLAGVNGSRPSGASESVAGGDVTALNGLRGVATTAMQPCTLMVSEWEDCGCRFHIRLVMVTNNSIGRDACAFQGLAKKRFRTGPIPFVAQEHIDNLSMLIYRAI